MNRVFTTVKKKSLFQGPVCKMEQHLMFQKHNADSTNPWCSMSCFISHHSDTQTIWRYSRFSSPYNRTHLSCPCKCLLLGNTLGLYLHHMLKISSTRLLSKCYVHSNNQQVCWHRVTSKNTELGSFISSCLQKMSRLRTIPAGLTGTVFGSPV